MARPFDFNPRVKRDARFRQYGLCAQCGQSMDDDYEHAHHVVPNQSGDAANPTHLWLKGSDNCVILCETCHYAVHDSGRYQTGAVAPPAYYKYSHGRYLGYQADHKKWVEGLNQKTKLL